MKTSFIRPFLCALPGLLLLLLLSPAHATDEGDEGALPASRASILHLPTGLGYSVSGDFALLHQADLPAGHFSRDNQALPTYAYTHGTFYPLSYQKNAAAFMPPEQQLRNSDRQYRHDDGRLNRFNIGVDAVRSVSRLIRN